MAAGAARRGTARRVGMPEEYVCQLEVAVKDFSVVNMLDSTTELNEPLPNGLLSNQALARPCELYSSLKISMLQR
jgi:hypothetical protein